MGVIQQVGQFSGNPYSFTIAGDTPTEQEAARISQILDQQELPYRQRYESQYGGIASLSQPVEEEVDTSIGGAFLTSLDQPLENFATTARLTGFEGTADFLSGLTEAPEGYESATEKFLNEEGTGLDLGMRQELLLSKRDSLLALYYLELRVLVLVDSSAVFPVLLLVVSLGLYFLKQFNCLARLHKNVLETMVEKFQTEMTGLVPCLAQVHLVH